MDQPTGVGAIGCSRSGVARGQRALLEADDAVGDVHTQRRCVDRCHADRCEVVREVSSRVELAVLGAVAAAFLVRSRKAVPLTEEKARAASRRQDCTVVPAPSGRWPSPPALGEAGTHTRVHPFRIRIYRNMMLDSTVVCRRALGCEWGGASTDPTEGGLGARNPGAVNARHLSQCMYHYICSSTLINHRRTAVDY